MLPKQFVKRYGVSKVDLATLLGCKYERARRLLLPESDATYQKPELHHLIILQRAHEDLQRRAAMDDEWETKAIQIAIYESWRNRATTQ